MVNFLEALYAITAVALMTVVHYAVRGRPNEKARDRFKGAVWMSILGIIACASLYWYLSP